MTRTYRASPIQGRIQLVGERTIEITVGRPHAMPSRRPNPRRRSPPTPSTPTPSQSSSSASGDVCGYDTDVS